MISEKTLRKWRKDALRPQIDLKLYEGSEGINSSLAAAYNEQQERILRLTQELMDHHLMRKG